MERNVLADRLKGYACFLVLFGHVIMGIRLAGVNIPQFFEGAEKFIWSFHVPLFLFLSGVVYKITGEWKVKKTKIGFVLHKLLNLGVPYIVFSAVYVAINSLSGAVNTEFALSDILYIWKTPVAQYWFLYALFFLFCIWTALSGILKNWQILLVVLVIGYGAPLYGISLGCFDVVFYSALGFGIGTFIDFSKVSKVPLWVKPIAVFIHLSAGIAFIRYGNIEAPVVKEIMILLGIYASIMLVSMIQSIKIAEAFFDFMNKYSFQIYLLHTIFTAGIRIVLLRFGVSQWLIHIVAGTLCGLVFSVLAAKIAQKIKILNFFFFPSRTIKQIKKEI